MTDDESPTWHTIGEAVRVVGYRAHVSRTTVTALTVGSVLFVINHLNTVLRGQVTAETWIKSGVTYLVPFCVANIGI